MKTALRTIGVANWATVALLLLLAACGGSGMSGYSAPPPPVAPSGLSYTSPTIAIAGTALTPLTPVVTGSPTSYAVSPALPAGLSLNTGTGVITGTPGAASAQATYTITASNVAGSTTFALLLQVNSPPPSAYTLSALVSDGAVAAVSTDAHLKNPWGLAALPGGPIWVANHGDRTSTVYDGTGLLQPVVVNIPAGVNGLGDVTGTVASSSSTDFVVSNGTSSGAARFLFATETGTISGWAPTVDATNAVVAYDDAAGGAVYTGLAIATNGSAAHLYAADFRNRKIDVFDASFAKIAASGGFTDSTLPADMSPFNIQAVQVGGNTVLVVTYAKQTDTDPAEEQPGAGEGLVDTFDLNGTLLAHLVARGAQLNAPWGVAVAPADFGTLGNALLIGNFGDGVINGFDATTGAFLGAVSDANGTPIATPGLWGLTFGNGGRNQPANVLYLAAGINGEANGLYARIDLGATAPDIVAPTGVAITAPVAAATVSGTTQVTANASDNVGVVRVVFSVRVGTTTTEIGTATATPSDTSQPDPYGNVGGSDAGTGAAGPFSVSWNTGATANGTATLIATAYDAYGNSTASAGVDVTVQNVPDTTPPTVALTAPAAGNVSGTVTVSVDASDNVGIAQVQFFAGATPLGTVTSAPYSVQWNTATFTGTQQLTAIATDGAGNTTTSAAVTVTVAASAPTLAQLQSSIFTPRCSGCHTGSGGALPGSMNLSSASATYAALVGISSQEVSSLQRVNPGNPDASYLIQKLEGTASVGARMPFGGPYLDQATIDGVRAWIEAGAAP